jgi:hypothetical protein
MAKQPPPAPKYWFYDLSQDRGMTVHTDGICRRRRGDRPHWTGPLTLAQVKSIDPTSYHICHECLSEDFTLLPRDKRDKSVKSRKGLAFLNGPNRASEPSGRSRRPIGDAS